MALMGDSSILTTAKAKESSGAASHDRPGFHIAGHHSARGNKSTFPDGHTREDDRSTSDGRSATDASGNQLPVRFRLQFAIVGGGARVAVVGEHDPVPDEDFVLDGHTGADEGMTGDLAAGTDVGASLDLDECPDAGVVPDVASVKVSEAVDDHVPTQLNCWRDPDEIRRIASLVRHHRHVKSPLRRTERAVPLVRECSGSLPPGAGPPGLPSDRH